MSNHEHSNLLSPTVAGWILAMTLALAAPVAGAARAQTTLTYTGPLPAGVTALKVENLAGHVSVTQGSRFEVTATVVASGSDEAAAQALAQTVKLDTNQSDDSFTVHVHYPVSQYDSYQYPAEHADNNGGDNDNFCFLGVFCVNGGGRNLSYQGSEVRVYRGSQRGTPLHVDLSVQLPANMKLALVNYVGRSELQGLQNDLRVKTSSGDVFATGVTGKFDADTGSGDVHAKNLSGDFSADTGSGDVFADGFKGSVHADTGSGDVFLSHTVGDMQFDTGSGDVRIKDAAGSLHADTGSGEVHAENYTSGASVWADTGSGDVSLSGDLSAMRKLYIDTGSGDATLHTTAGLSLHLEASSDSGDLDINLPDMRNVVTHRGSFSADFGQTQGHGTISTGSGDITVTQP